jgi:hypothetical protein
MSILKEIFWGFSDALVSHSEPSFFISNIPFLKASGRGIVNYTRRAERPPTWAI